MLFSKKEKVDLEEYSRNFYENVFLNAKVAGQDGNKVFYKTMLNTAIEADPVLSDITPEKFASEFTLIQFELFGLAWLHRFNVDSAIKQSIFTKNYLHNKNLDKIWKDFKHYNQAVARSSTAGKDDKKRIDRGYLGKRTMVLAETFEKYSLEGFDSEGIARAVNRLFTEGPWNKGITENFVMFVLLDRLKLKPDQPNKDAQQKLVFMVRMLYNRNKEVLGKIEVN